MADWLSGVSSGGRSHAAGRPVHRHLRSGFATSRWQQQRQRWRLEASLRSGAASHLTEVGGAAVCLNELLDEGAADGRAARKQIMQMAEELLGTRPERHVNRGAADCSISAYGYKPLCHGGPGHDRCLGVSGRSGRLGGLARRCASAHQQASTIYPSREMFRQAPLYRTAIYSKTDTATVGFGGWMADLRHF